jgi:hypothetical protein
MLGSAPEGLDTAVVSKFEGVEIEALISKRDI